MAAEIWDVLISGLAEALQALVSVLVLAASAWVAQRFRVELTAEQRARVERAVRFGIDYAEQQARRAAKLETREMSADEKRGLATQKAAAQLKRPPPAGAVEDLIEAELGRRNSAAPPPMQ